MATKRELIVQGFEEIGIASSAFDLQAEELDTGLRRLNQLMAEWDVHGIRLGFNMGGTLNEDSGIPESAIFAVCANLGLRLASSFGKAVSPQTMLEAKKAYDVLVSYGQTIPEYQFPSILPIGRGNRRATNSQQYFTPQDSLDAGADSEFSFE